MEPSAWPLGKLFPVPCATGCATTGRSRPTSDLRIGSSASAPAPVTTRYRASRQRRRRPRMTAAVSRTVHSTPSLPSQVTALTALITLTAVASPATRLFSRAAVRWSSDSSGAQRSRTSTSRTVNTAAAMVTAASGTRLPGRRGRHCPRRRRAGEADSGAGMAAKCPACTSSHTPGGPGAYAQPMAMTSVPPGRRGCRCHAVRPAAARPGRRARGGAPGAGPGA